MIRMKLGTAGLEDYHGKAVKRSLCAVQAVRFLIREDKTKKNRKLFRILYTLHLFPF
jgi:hypothetical protein